MIKDRNTKHKMGVQKKTRKFATVKRVISQRDDRLKKNQPTPLDKQKKQSGKDELVRTMYGHEHPIQPVEHC